MIAEGLDLGPKRFSAALWIKALVPHSPIDQNPTSVLRTRLPKENDIYNRKPAVCEIGGDF
jgi:hypothetical protein